MLAPYLVRSFSIMDLVLYLLFKLVAIVAPAAFIYALVQRAVITITRAATGRSVDL